MKKTMQIVVISLAGLTTLLLIINSFVKRSIETEIEIKAPAEMVWSTLMDHQQYPMWNPFIKSISGSTVPGETLLVTVQSEGQKPMSFEPLVLKNEVNEEFRWIGKLLVKGVFDGEHYFLIERVSPTRVRFIQGEQFTGIFSGILISMIGESTKNGFIAMNKALKTSAESQEQLK